jgi:hypothetical protein
MAELALSTIGLAGLFSNALECFQLVRVGQSFGRDVETFQCRLNLLALRLSQWGEAAGLNSITEGDELHFSKDNIDVARDALQQIVTLFQSARQRSQGRDRRATESDFSASMKAMCAKIRDLSFSRINKKAKPNVFNKASWALIGHQEFENLVNSISSLVDDLIAAFPAKAMRLEELCEADAAELLETDKKAPELLKEAMGKQNVKLRSALEKAAPTHHNTANFSGENKGLQQGQNYGSMTNHFGGS